MNSQDIKEAFTKNAKEFDDLMVEVLSINNSLITLLEVAVCPQCDGSGAYHGNDGEPEQCQWCYEKRELL